MKLQRRDPRALEEGEEGEGADVDTFCQTCFVTYIYIHTYMHACISK